MDVYIATTLTRAADHRRVHRKLVEHGHRLTYDWTIHGSVQSDGPARMREVAADEVSGVLRADALIVLLPGGRGTHVELGVAIGLGLDHVLLVGEQHDAAGECAFYYHPNVRRFVDEDAAIAHLDVVAKKGSHGTIDRSPVS